ncbi:sigma-54-dependent transcriptional regulator [Pseudomonas oryzihabitans]|uniref:sigma-54-dependent transcriptional regulator n=1 Tax=Pseudomonas oryzihabitans TaxID=47885 RepID=UPI00363DB111
MPTLLIIDDDAGLRDALAETAADQGYRVLQADGGEAGLQLLTQEAVDAVLLDLRMPGLDGLEVLARIRALPEPPAVTVLTAFASAGNTIEAMRLGAFDHLTKPIGRDELIRVLAGMTAQRGPASTPPATVEGHTLVGGSDALRQVQKTIGRLVDSEATVLVTGETGTGKELVARAIHEHGKRRGAPFVAVNCAAIPPDLLESELFGHVRGAFSGATANRLGAFREAQGGTLFLDEIGDMPLPMQAKILRALQEREVTPVGGAPVRLDVRLVAATHRDLAQRVASGDFREDLFYRLHVVPIHLPALRERRADILPLAEHFLAPSGRVLADDAAALLLRHPWPGNVRELRNAIQRAATLAQGERIVAADLAFLQGETPDGVAIDASWPEETLAEATARLERLLIERALQRSGGNRAEAARRLGIHRQLLYTKLSRLGLGVGTDDSPA